MSSLPAPGGRSEYELQWEMLSAVHRRLLQGWAEREIARQRRKRRMRILALTGLLVGDLVLVALILAAVSWLT